jgi:hypothetical protein
VYDRELGVGKVKDEAIFSFSRTQALKNPVYGEN